MYLSHLAVAAAVAVAPAHSPSPSFSDTVSDAVFETCSSVMAGELSLGDAAAVRKLGFEPVPPPADGRDMTPMGKMQMVQKSLADGMLAVAAVGQAFCQVQFEGKAGVEVLQSVGAQLLSDDYGFVADPENQGTRNGIAVQAYKKPVDGAVARVQLMTAPQKSGNPRLMVQMMVTEQ